MLQDVSPNFFFVFRKLVWFRLSLRLSRSTQWAEIVTATMSARQNEFHPHRPGVSCGRQCANVGSPAIWTVSLSAYERSAVPIFTNEGMHSMHATEGRILQQERSSSVLVCQVLHFLSSVDPDACHGGHGVSSTTVLSNRCSPRCP